MNSAISPRFSTGLQPPLAWTAILGLTLYSLLLILAGAGKILTLTFPIGAFAVGLLLYLRYPVLYVGFTWWILFLTPLIRRLADYRSSFTNPSPMLLAPYLVILVTLATLWRHLPKTYRHGGLPFVLSFAGIAYGALIGLVKYSPAAVALASLEWIAPALFGFHLFVYWQDYPRYRQNIERVFVWGALIMGTYGVIQYFVLPMWDRFWLGSLFPILISVGKPEPMQIRVWSTLNSPGVFGSVMMAALLILFNYRGIWRLPATAVGYLSFLLTSVRTAWLGWAIGLVILAGSLKAGLQRRLLLSIMITALCVVPLSTIEPFASVISTRLETFTNLAQDDSAQARADLYAQSIDKVLTDFIGWGISDKLDFDSGILDILLSLGWVGACFYLGGIFLLFFKAFQKSKEFSDPFISASQAIVLGTFAQLLSGRVTQGPSGVLFWSFLAMIIASHKYYRARAAAIE